MSGETTDGALAGIKVVDLSRVLGGPFCTQVLGDHGADVIKIEPPQGDETRHWGPPFHAGEASYFIGANRNKRSIGLDLSVDEGRAVLLRMLKEADVLVENFKPGTLEKWGLGYDDLLRERFPRLIVCSVTGFGSTGPLGGLPGYDAIIQAMTGIMSINGDPAGGPTRMGVPVVDLSTGLYAVIGILMALQERHVSGLGQHVDISLFDCGLSLMHPHVPNYLYSDTVPGRSGNAHPNISPYDQYPCRDGAIFIAAGNDHAFARLCAELGAPELADDARFASNAERIRYRPELTDALTSLLADQQAEALSTRLLAAGLTAGPIWNTAQAVSHAHAKHRDMAVEQGWYRGTGTPVKLSRASGSVRRLPPHFGADSRQILLDEGFSEEEVARLVDASVVLEERRSR